MAILEAMALELPIVCTRTGCEEAVNDGETGLVCEPRPADLANTINKMLTLQSQWQQIGKAGRLKYEQQFNGVNSINRLAALYELNQEEK